MSWTWPWTPLLTTQQLKEIIVGATQDAVDQIVAQLAKAQAEIVDRIADLEAQIAAGETPDLSALKAAAQSLDDVVVDVVVEEPPVV